MVPLQNALGPSFTMICLAQSQVFLYLWASKPCMLQRRERKKTLHLSFIEYQKQDFDNWRDIFKHQFQNRQIRTIVRVRIYAIEQKKFYRVLITSRGVFPKTEHAPANPPKRPTTHFGTDFFGSPSRYQSLQDSITKKRMAWLLPCLRIVAVTPVFVLEKINLNTLGSGASLDE